MTMGHPRAIPWLTNANIGRVIVGWIRSYANIDQTARVRWEYPNS